MSEFDYPILVDKKRAEKGFNVIQVVFKYATKGMKVAGNLWGE